MYKFDVDKEQLLLKETPKKNEKHPISLQDDLDSDMEMVLTSLCSY